MTAAYIHYNAVLMTRSKENRRHNQRDAEPFRLIQNYFGFLVVVKLGGVGPLDNITSNE